MRYHHLNHPTNSEMQCPTPALKRSRTFNSDAFGQLLLVARQNRKVQVKLTGGIRGIGLSMDLPVICRNPISSSLVLVLSMHGESLYAERALRSGASGYITKHQDTEEVLSAIRRVLAGEIYLSEKMTTFFLKSLGATGAKSVARPLDRLTDRKLQVLEFIGSGYTTREIAGTLKVGVATVDTYRARIKEKMDFRSAVELQHFAIRWVRDRE